jgi:hypothetical protein
MKAALFSTVFVFFSLAAHAEEFGSLTPQEVNARRVQKNVFVFDNNEPGRFKKSHVAGAKWLNPYDAKESDFPNDKSATLIFYCANEH